MPARKTLLLTPLVLLLWLLTSLGAYHAWVHGADHRDFYPRWAGARLALFEGRDLYSEETTHRMQQMLYGRILPANRDQQGFAYPAQLVVILFPFWLITDVEIATAVWQGLSLLLLLAALLLARSLVDPRPPVWLFVFLLAWQYPLLMLFQGQITALVLLSLTVGLWGFLRGQDALAGAGLALAVIKPELALLPWLALLALSLRARRWKLLIAFIIAHVVLFLFSLLAAGWWLPRWISALTSYRGYAQTNWALAMLWQISPILMLALPAAIAGALWTTWSDARLCFAAAISAGLLLLPQTLFWGLTVLLVPIVLIYRGRMRWFALFVWLLGWLALLLPTSAWQAQTLALPSLVLAAVALTSIYVSKPAQQSRKMSSHPPAS